MMVNHEQVSRSLSHSGREALARERPFRNSLQFHNGTLELLDDLNVVVAAYIQNENGWLETIGVDHLTITLLGPVRDDGPCVLHRPTQSILCFISISLSYILGRESPSRDISYD